MLNYTPPSIPKWVEKVLDLRLPSLANCYQLPLPPSSGAKSKLESRKLSLDGHQVQVGEKEYKVALEISEHLQIDQIEAFVIYKSLQLDRPEIAELHIQSDDFWGQVTEFYFGEWLSKLQLACFILRSGR